MRKGSYSEELVGQVVVAMNTKEIDASRWNIYLSKPACKIPNTLLTRCEVTLLYHMGPSVRRKFVCAVLRNVASE